MAEEFRINSIDPEALDAERHRVLALLAARVPSEYVHEVGSTAVAGVVGKQDLDFLVLVPTRDFLILVLSWTSGSPEIRTSAPMKCIRATKLIRISMCRSS